jgi:hypothetical protein
MAVAAYISWFKTPDRPARTAKARAAAENKFLIAADGDPVRAEALKQAHYNRMRLNSLRSRRAAKEARLAREAAKRNAIVNA